LQGTNNEEDDGFYGDDYLHCTRKMQLVCIWRQAEHMELEEHLQGGGERYTLLNK